VKLLLDEYLPHLLRHEIPGHDCYTVVYMKYARLSNGRLLNKAASDGFDVLLTMTGASRISRAPWDYRSP
jgi:hypothetical protein